MTVYEGGSFRLMPDRQPSAYPARPDQVRVGDIVYSTYGGRIGRVAYSDRHVAVVKSSRWALRLPVEAFGTSRDQLLLDMSRSRFDKLAAQGGARVN